MAKTAIEAPRPKGGESEKITINLGPVDLGQIDLQRVDLLSSGEVPTTDHAAGLGIMCAQQLHRLGKQRHLWRLRRNFILAGPKLSLAMCA